MSKIIYKDPDYTKLKDANYTRMTKLACITSGRRNDAANVFTKDQWEVKFKDDDGLVWTGVVLALYTNGEMIVHCD